MTKMNCNQNKYVNKWNYTLSHNDTAILSKFSNEPKNNAILFLDGY